MVIQEQTLKAELPGCLRMVVECLQGWAVVMHLQILWKLENKAGIALGLCAEAAACSECAVPFSAFISQPGQLLLLVLGSGGLVRGVEMFVTSQNSEGMERTHYLSGQCPDSSARCTQIPGVQKMDIWCDLLHPQVRLFFFLFRLVQ